MSPAAARVVVERDGAARRATGPGKYWHRRLPLIAVVSSLLGAAAVVPFVLKGAAGSPPPGKQVSPSLSAQQPGSRGSTGAARLESSPSHLALPPDVSAGAGKISSLAYSPSGAILAIADTGKICLWSIASRKCTATVTSAWALAFSPDGATLATSALDGTIREWNTRSGNQRGRAFANQQSAGALCVAFSPDGKVLAVGDENGSANLWNAATGALIGRLTDPGGTTVNAVAFSPEGNLAVGDGNGDVYLWNISLRKTIARIHDSGGDGVQVVAFGKGGKVLAAGDGNGRTHLWQQAPSGSWRLIRVLPAPRVAGNRTVRVGAVAFSRDGTRLAIGELDGTTDLWDAATWRLIRSLPDASGGGETAVAFSSDGKTLATGDEHGDVYLWRLG